MENGGFTFAWKFPTARHLDYLTPCPTAGHLGCVYTWCSSICVRALAQNGAQARARCPNSWQAHENQAVFTLEAIKNSNRAPWWSTKSERSLIFKTESGYWTYYLEFICVLKFGNLTNKYLGRIQFLDSEKNRERYDDRVEPLANHKLEWQADHHCCKIEMLGNNFLSRKMTQQVRFKRFQVLVSLSTSGK